VDFLSVGLRVGAAADSRRENGPKLCDGRDRSG
jgi:hypothetical protein